MAAFAAKSTREHAVWSQATALQESEITFAARACKKVQGEWRKKFVRRASNRNYFTVMQQKQHSAGLGM
jgi:hypothetical protein